jgi:hypothetical protein
MTFYLLAFAASLGVLCVFQIGLILGWRWGKRRGQRIEVMCMIELMEALKLDNYDQQVFRDRITKALSWVLLQKDREENRG